jgi:hypothetical protein
MPFELPLADHASQHGTGRRCSRVVAEGLSGRATAYDDWTDIACRAKRAQSILPTLLDSHEPLDLIIIMLGTRTTSSRSWPARRPMRCPARERLVEQVARACGNWRDANDPTGSCSIVAPPVLVRDEQREHAELRGLDPCRLDRRVA